MKGADIQPGKRYAAKVDFRNNVIVDVLEKGVQRSHGYGTKTRSDGVRVRVAVPYTHWSREVPAGTEKIVTTRDITHEWTDEHEQRREQREAEEAEIQRRMAALRDALLMLRIDAKVGRNGVVLGFDAADALIALASPRKDNSDG